MMPRGKKTSPEVIYQIMTSWAVTDSFAETSRVLNIPIKTVEKIVKDNMGSPEFAELCSEKKLDFANKASKIIDKGMTLLDRRFNRAIEQEESLDILIEEIFASSKEELSQDEKNRLVSKLRALQLQDVKAITTAVGTLYDKRALAKGKITDNIKVSVELPPEMIKYAE